MGNLQTTMANTHGGREDSHNKRSGRVNRKFELSPLKESVNSVGSTTKHCLGKEPKLKDWRWEIAGINSA